MTVSLMMGITLLLAQQPTIEYEYGNPQELKGVTKIYVYTGTQLSVRQDIGKGITKKLRQLQVVDKAEDAEVMLVFGADSTRAFAGLRTSGSSTSSTAGGTTNTDSSSVSRARYETVTSGSGLVGKVVGPNRVRLLMDFSDSQHSGTGLVSAGLGALHGSPSVNFAKAFIEAYLLANGKGK
jgi:hypothetical protein